jgi:hypothetical protein
METESHGCGGTEEKGPGGASGRGGMRGGLRRCEVATEGQAVWRGTDALWVCDDAAVYRGGGEESNGIARDLGEAVCDAVCGWTRRRRRAKRRDERPEGPGRSKTEVPAAEGRQILEEQSILEGSNHVQMYVNSVGFQARRSATGGSPPPVSGVRRSDRCTARRGAPPCDLGSCGKYCYFAGSRRNGGWIGAMQGAGG